MPRVYEIARELGLTSSEVLQRLRAMDAPAATHSSAVDDAVAQRLREDVNNGSRPAVSTALPGAASDAGLAVEPSEAAERRTVHEVHTLPRKHSLLRAFAELPVLVVLAFGIAIVIKTFLVQAFFIPSGSMLPTLQVGDRVLVEKISYFFGDPSRQDVVVFAKEVFGSAPPDVPWYRDAQNFVRELLGLPTGQEEDYIKRVVAVGGDTIRYVGKPRRLVVNGQHIAEPFVKGGRDTFSSTITRKDCRRLDMEPSGRGCKVPAGQVFVMGDNRSSSEDSRVLGPVAEDKIVGRAFVVIWPPRDIGGL